MTDLVSVDIEGGNIPLGPPPEYSRFGCRDIMYSFANSFILCKSVCGVYIFELLQKAWAKISMMRKIKSGIVDGCVCG